MDGKRNKIRTGVRFSGHDYSLFTAKSVYPMDGSLESIVHAPYAAAWEIEQAARIKLIHFMFV